MPQKRYGVDQIIPMLRRADVELGKGKKVPEVCKLLGIAGQTYYRWRQKYGGMAPEMTKELKALQKENARLKKMVAEQALDMEILKEAAKGNWEAPNDDGERSSKCVAVWGQRRCRSVAHAACSTTHVALNDTNRAGQTMNHDCFVRCVLCPGNAHALERSVFIDCWSSVIGR